MKKYVAESLKTYKINEAMRDVYYVISDGDGIYRIEDKNGNTEIEGNYDEILDSIVKIGDINRFEAKAILRDVDNKGRSSILIHPFRFSM
jgi:hypothetical protein